MKRKFVRTCICLIMLLSLLSADISFAQEEYYESFMRIEFEAEEAPRDEIQNMQRQLAELEFYYSELKSQEAAALKGIPVSMKDKKFKTSLEKANYYKKFADKYAGKLANEELTKSDIKVSQNLMILSELYKTQEAVKTLKKEIENKKSPKTN